MASKPLMIFEIKKAVNGNPGLVALGHLTQTFLEGFYCCQQHELKKVVVCLTDTSSWHFLEVGYMSDDKRMVSILSGTTWFVQAQDEYGSLIHFMASVLCKLINDEYIVPGASV